MNIKSIRKETGLSQSKFATHFEIPVRTIQQWEQEVRTPPSYVVKLIKRVLTLEEKLHGKDL